MTRIAAHLADPALEDEIEQNGYVVIKELFSKDEVSRILELYKQTHAHRDPQRPTMWNSLFDIPLEDGLRLSDEIFEIIHPKLDKIFIEYSAPVTCLMSKNIGDDSICRLHRDTSILDEATSEYRNVWIPLTDTHEKNGALYILKGSNHFFNYPKPAALSWHYGALEDTLLPLTDTLYSQAGDCVIFTDMTLHGSHRNYTDDYRPVIFIGVLHPSAETMYYFYDDQKKELRAYAVPTDFYFGNDFKEPVGVHPLRFAIPYAPPAVDPADIVARLREYNAMVESK